MRLIDADALKAKLKIGTNTATYSDYCNGYCDARQVDLDAIDVAPTIEPEVRLIPKEVSATDIDKLTEMIKDSLLQAYPNDAMFTAVRHGRWIECDYKHMEHGMIETEPKAGLCCSKCRTAFQKKKMTYKQYCAACGARMDGGAYNGFD